MSHLRYLWAHPYGRLALALVAVGLLGLTVHYWTGFVLLAGIRLPRSGMDRLHRKPDSSLQLCGSVTANCAGGQMTQVLDQGVALTTGDSEVTS